MLAYAPRRNGPHLRPATLGLIILGHAGLLAVVMTAKSGLLPKTNERTDIIFVPESKPPPEPRPQPRPQPRTQPSESEIATFDPIIRDLPAPGPNVDDLPGPTVPSGPVSGTEPAPAGSHLPLDPPLVRTAPRLATLGDDLRPPYPDSMREAEQEASLKLRLTIDARGRVTSVDPVGAADPVFFAAARRHILRAWRYRPAMEGSTPVPATITVTLKFELGNA